jgi:uncharacterized protein YsxB (DUF464 family)
MISIIIERDGDYTSINCNGHANFSDGNDIVCAGVSAIVQSFVGAIINMEVDEHHEMDSGYCKIRVGKGAERELRMLIIGIKMIEKAYPKNVLLTLNYEL